MSLPKSAADYYRSQQRITARTVVSARRQWNQIGRDFTSGWRRVGPRIVALIAAGQTAATRQVEPYIVDVLEETGQAAEAVGALVPAGLIGVTGEGRRLSDVAYGAVVASKMSFAKDAVSTAQAVEAGRDWLDMMIQTALADAARQAESVAIAARPQVTGYVRMLNPPSCSRCAILAGRFYRWNDGFARHPRCDCRHIPAAEDVADDLTTDPSAYFASLSPAEQDKIFTKAGAAAIRDGADIGQVVNARSGMYTTADGARATTAGTSSRGRSPGYRVMPEQIYSEAGSRAEAIALLRRYGYLA